jgi:hypothetical protein
LAWVSSAASYTYASYTADISSIWIKLGEGIAALLKRMVLVLEGGSGAVMGIRWFKDFSPSSSTTTYINLRPITTGTTSLWGAATSLYGASTSTYAPVYGLREYKTPLSGSAKHVKLNLSIVSNGYDASIQDLSIISLQGKLR